MPTKSVARLILTPGRHSVECSSCKHQTYKLLTGYRDAEIGVTHGESRKDALSNGTTVGTRSSILRQPRLAHPINQMLGVFRVLMETDTFRAFNCETGIDPQHFRGFGPRLLKLS